MIPYLWERLTCNDQAVSVLARELRISPAIARLLAIRGIDEPETAQRFLHPSLDHLHDPFRLADMAAGVERILAAIERNERIAIHGDYDCDGITSTVILRRALELFGANVIHFLPDRLKDGYGLQPETFDRLQADGVTLVISVDCGIRGIDAAKRARELGIDLIITDHHEPDVELPVAVAVINPRRHDCDYPTRTSQASASRSSWFRRFVESAVASGCCRRSSRWRPSGRLRTSCRSSARIASLRSSASTCCRRDRTKSDCGRCSTSPV